MRKLMVVVGDTYLLNTIQWYSYIYQYYKQIILLSNIILILCNSVSSLDHTIRICILNLSIAEGIITHHILLKIFSTSSKITSIHVSTSSSSHDYQSPIFQILPASAYRESHIFALSTQELLWVSRITLHR